MNFFPAFRIGVASLALVLASMAGAADAPRAWPADQFLPITEARIAALPVTEQPAWRAYWVASAERSSLMPGRKVAENTPLKRIEGPPIPSHHSKGVRLRAPDEWFASEEAQAVADRVVNWQTVAGGWVK